MGGKRLRIGIDCDEPLADFNAHLCPWMNKKYGTNYCVEDIHTVKLWEIWGCSKEEAMRRIVEFYASAEFDAITPTEGSIEGVAALAEEDDLFVITSRASPAIEKTEPFIRKYYDGKFKDILFSGNYALKGGNHKKKADICAVGRIDLMIEDFLQYSLECLEEHLSRKTPNVLFDRPWNREREMQEEGLERLPSGIVRAVGWPEVVPLVKLLKENREKFYRIQKYKDLT